MSKKTTQGVTSVGVVGSIGITGVTSGYSNTAIGTSGVHGTIGSQGIAGQAGFSITDWKDDMMKKYNNRFTIKTEYDEMTLTPIKIIIDTNTNQEYKFKPTWKKISSASDMLNEMDKFIQSLVITIRDSKISDILK